MVTVEWGTSIQFLAIRHDSSKPFTCLRYDKTDRDETDCETETVPRGLASYDADAPRTRDPAGTALAPGPRDPDTRADEQLIP
jgi:hypothetical protein